MKITKAVYVGEAWGGVASPLATCAEMPGDDLSSVREPVVSFSLRAIAYIRASMHSAQLIPLFRYASKDGTAP